MKKISIILFQLFSVSIIDAATNSTRHFYSLSAIQHQPTLQSTRSLIKAQASEFDQCIEETDIVLGTITNPKRLTFSDWKDSCPGFPDAKELDCDFSQLAYNNEECASVGGQILPITIDICSTNVYIEKKNGSGYNIFLQKLRIENFPQCAGMSCDSEAISTMIKGDNKLYGTACPQEWETGKFAFNYKKNKLNLKSCKWLSQKNDVTKSKICQNKKFQLYAEGYLPASRVCPITCAEYNCVQQKSNSMFVYDAYVDFKGIMKPIIRKCNFLGKKDEEERSQSCAPTNKKLAYVDTRIGYGWEVCTEFCASSCQKK